MTPQETFCRQLVTTKAVTIRLRTRACRQRGYLLRIPVIVTDDSGIVTGHSGRA